MPTSKSGFIRNLPLDLSAKDVVAKAAASGITLTEGYVYAIRSSAKRSSSSRRSVANAPASKPTSFGRLADPVKEILRIAIAAAGIDGAAKLLEDASARIDLIV